VVERITFSFDGDFSGAFREIPLRPGESISRVYVAENGKRYTPGASAELQSSGAPGTFGTTRTDKGLRIVWPYRASFEDRTFTIGYTISGLAVAYDDVVDVNLKVWGSEWKVGLGELHASIRLPGRARGPSYRVWGAPELVRGVVSRRPTHADLTALNIPAGQFVELRVLFPRSLLTSTSGARVVHEKALHRIVAEEQQSAASFESDRRQIRDAVDHIWRTILILLALGLGPALLLAGGVYLLFGRERRSTYDREYEQEPPSDLEPALVTPLLRQSTGVGSNEFTATLFDLIRRKRFKASPVMTETSTWGGLRKEEVADLEISKGEDGKLTTFEQDVADVVDSVVTAGPERLSKFRDRITAERTENAKRFQSFKTAVESAVKQRRWFEDAGARILGLGIGAFVLAAVVLLWVGIDGFRALAPRWSDVVLIALGACAVVNAAILVFAHTIGEFGVVLMIGGNIPGITKVASIAVFDEVESLRFGNAHLHALILFALSFAILITLFAVNRKNLKPF